MKSALFVRVKTLYDAGRLTEAGLDVAVARGWITEAEKDEILGIEE